MTSFLTLSPRGWGLSRALLQVGVWTLKYLLAGTTGADTDWSNTINLNNFQHLDLSWAGEEEREWRGGGCLPAVTCVDSTEALSQSQWMWDVSSTDRLLISLCPEVTAVTGCTAACPSESAPRFLCRNTGTRTEPEPSEGLPDWLIDPHLPIKALNY